MKITHYDSANRENKSLVLNAVNGYDFSTLKNLLAVCQTVKQAFFMPEKLVNPTISQHSQGNTIISHDYVRIDGLILQNKPFGEYVERLLIVPRVRPITLNNLGYLLKNLLGA